jgi:hypothetical protein
MANSYIEELRAQLGRSRGHRRRDHDRDIARLLAPWRGHGIDPVSRRG